MALRQPHSLLLFKAADGTAAVDMAVGLVSQPLQCVVGEYASFQIATPNGPVGTWSVEESNDQDSAGNAPTYNGMWDAFPADLLASSATQPGGTGAVVTTLTTIATCAFKRIKWTPSSAGSGVLPTKIKAVRGSML